MALLPPLGRQRPSCLLYGMTTRYYTGSSQKGNGHGDTTASATSHRRDRIKIASFEPTRRRAPPLHGVNGNNSGNRRITGTHSFSPHGSTFYRKGSFPQESDMFTVRQTTRLEGTASDTGNRSQTQPRPGLRNSPLSDRPSLARQAQASSIAHATTGLSSASHSLVQGNDGDPRADLDPVQRPQWNVANAETIKHTFSPDPTFLKRIQPEGRLPTLGYGLERVLFNPGVHWLRDLRTNVYNFDPFLRQLPRPEAFNFELIPPFTPASRDHGLLKKAQNRGCAYVTSTSSISQSMSTVYFALSRMRPLSLDMLSQPFADEPHTFTLLTRSPTTVLLKPHGSNLRSIVIEKGIDEPESVLSQLGQVMERLLTEPKENFLKMLRSSSTPPQVRSEDTYAYTIADKILMRSQLDCHDPRLPNCSFDLKTRAALPIRMDVQNYQKYQEYRLLSTHGLYCSFEREYYDMCRSAFLKYNFQVRIGNMDGIFVAYHNANEIFGFQYVSREEMDQRLYGNSLTGDQSFNLILQVYNAILEATVPLYPSDSLIRLTFATDKIGSRLTVFSEDCGRPNEGGEPDASLTKDADDVDALSIPAGRNVMQFTITMSSVINGFRTEQVLLNPRGCDQWLLNCTISRVPLNVSEYDSVRSKATAQRTPDPDEAGRETNFLRIISERSQAAAVTGTKMGSLDGEIIAPWTIPSAII